MTDTRPRYDIPISWRQDPALQYSYNAAFPKLNIGLDWLTFKKWLGSQIDECFTLDQWNDLYDKFQAHKAAASERDTLLDALM